MKDSLQCDSESYNLEHFDNNVSKSIRFQNDSESHKRDMVLSYMIQSCFNVTRFRAASVQYNSENFHYDAINVHFDTVVIYNSTT